jgi:predicted nucleic acid-binding Zn ribbon protein
MSDEGSGKREPQAVGELLDGVLERLGVARGLDIAELVHQWETVAPEPFAATARPVGLAGGELTLEVDDGGTASRLRYQLGMLLARLEERLGTGVVTGVRLRVRRPQNRS